MTRGYAWSEPPVPGEALVGFVARNLARHGLWEVSVCLRPAGIRLKDPGFLAARVGPEALGPLADLFRTDRDEIATRTHPAALSGCIGNRTKGLITFFGASVRRTFFSPARRVSPRSLAASGHHRASWHLRPLRFCPESREELISVCPHPGCGRPLGWLRASHPTRCEHCGVDLRDHPQPVLPCEDADALGFLTGLVDPSPLTRDAAAARIPPALSRCGRGELFEFGVMLAKALDQTPDRWQKVRLRLRTDADFECLTPRRLAEVGRLLLGWPDSFHTLADRLRVESGARNAVHGRIKELGFLNPLALDPRLPAGPAAALRVGIEANMLRTPVLLRVGPLQTSSEWISLGKAAAEFSISRRSLGRMRARGDVDVLLGGKETLVLMRRAQLAAIAKADADAIRVPQASRLLGVASADVHALAEAGLIRALAGPALEVWLGVPRILASSIRALEAELEVGTPVNADTQRWSVPLDRAFALNGLAPPQWAAVLRAVLDGRLRAFRPNAHRLRPVLSRISLSHGVARRLGLILGLQAEAMGGGTETLTGWEAGVRLGVLSSVVADLIMEGWLKGTRTGRAMTVDGGDLASFRSRYMLTGEVALLTGHGCNSARLRMTDRGIVPVALVGASAFSLWDRGAVLRSLSPGQPAPGETVEVVHG